MLVSVISRGQSRQRQEGQRAKEASSLGRYKGVGLWTVWIALQ